MLYCWNTIPAGLSTTFEVGGASARVGGEIDYFCTGTLSGINEIVKKWGGANDMSRWRNRPPPPLADNPDNTTTN